MSHTSIEGAVGRADWLIRYAIDLLPHPTRRLHPGVRSHLVGGCSQLAAVVKLLDPINDQYDPAAVVERDPLVWEGDGG